MLKEFLSLRKVMREEKRLERAQQARDDAEINAKCWELKLQHRTRDLKNLAEAVVRGV